MATSSVLDRKFVGGPIALGLAYALIIVALDHFIGKEAAGVAGVALTALAGAIFKQFETLRFRQIQEHETTVVLVPRLYSWYLLLLIFSFYGLSIAFSGFYRLVLNNVPSAIVSEFIKFKFLGLYLTGVLWLLSLVLSHFAGGFISGKTAPARRYTYAVLASIVSLILTFVFGLLGISILGLEGLFVYLSLSIIFPAVALLGARWGFTQRTRTR